MFSFDRQCVKYKSAAMLAVLAGDTISPPLSLIDRVRHGHEPARWGGWLAALLPPTYTPTGTHTSEAFAADIQLPVRARILVSLKSYSPLLSLSFWSILTIGASACCFFKHTFAVSFEQFRFSPSLFTCMKKRTHFFYLTFAEKQKDIRKTQLPYYFSCYFDVLDC